MKSKIYYKACNCFIILATRGAGIQWVHSSRLSKLLVNLLYMRMSGEHVSERVEELVKILRNYKALVNSEYKVEQWLQERMGKDGNNGKDHLEE